MKSDIASFEPEKLEAYINFSESLKLSSDSIKVKLYAQDESTEINDITDILDVIDNAHHPIKNVCEKPKTHLKSINEVRPIDTVKRVGYESIAYLAGHSEDWLARTASGLKPARLFSRIEDDDFLIYENRVVKTLIDKVIKYLKEQINIIENAKAQLDAIMSSGVQANSFGFDAGHAKALSILLKGGNTNSVEYSRNFELAEKLLAESKDLKKKYLRLKYSLLYRKARKTKVVTGVLNNTNILLMDKNYNAAYKLWPKIPKSNTTTTDLEAKSEDADSAVEAYSDFCKRISSFAVETIGFNSDKEGNWFTRSDNIQISFSNIDTNGFIVISIRDITKNSLDISNFAKPSEKHNLFEIQGNNLYWENTVKESDIEEFCKALKPESKSKKNDNEQRKKYTELKKAITDKNKTDYQVFSILIAPHFIELKDENSIQTINDLRLDLNKKIDEYKADFCICCLPLVGENEQKIINYGRKDNEKIAILSISLFDINSYRRIQSILLRYIFQISYGKSCPYCGGKLWESPQGLKCQDCELISVETKCKYCDYTYKYLKYYVSNAILEIISETKKNGSFWEKDSLFKYKDIVELDVGETIIPICPKCGNSVAKKEQTL